MSSMSDGTGLAPPSARDPVRSLEAALERVLLLVVLVLVVCCVLLQTDNLDGLRVLILA